MADDITVPSEIADVATLDVAGRHFQRVLTNYLLSGVPTNMDAKPATELSLAALLATQTVFNETTGNITATQATISTPVAGATVTLDVNKSSLATFFCTGTFSIVNCTFEATLDATGDTGWFGIQVARTNANTIELLTGNLSATPAYAWRASVAGYSRVRVRCTALGSGTQTWKITSSAAAFEPAPNVGVTAAQPVTLQSGSSTVGTVNIGYSSNSAGASNPFKFISAASANATLVKASSGKVLGIDLANTTASWVYVHWYNSSTIPTAGAGTPTAVTALAPNLSKTYWGEAGTAFSSGIGFTVTTGSADTDATAITAGAVIGTIYYA